MSPSADTHQTGFVVVITTTDKEQESESLTEVIIREKLAACAQILPIRSRYWWKGSVETADEWQIQFKTTAALREPLVCRIVQLHSYETPEVVCLPITAGNEAYLQWVHDSTQDPAPTDPG